MNDTYEQVRKRTFRLFKGQNHLAGRVRIASAELKRADIELREGDVAFLTLSLGGLKLSVIKFKEPFYV
jgi:hypothetical protein